MSIMATNKTAAPIAIRIITHRYKPAIGMEWREYRRNNITFKFWAQFNIQYVPKKVNW